MCHRTAHDLRVFGGRPVEQSCWGRLGHGVLANRVGSVRAGWVGGPVAAAVESRWGVFRHVLDRPNFTNSNGTTRNPNHDGPVLVLCVPTIARRASTVGHCHRGDTDGGECDWVSNG